MTRLVIDFLRFIVKLPMHILHFSYIVLLVLYFIPTSPILYAVVHLYNVVWNGSKRMKFVEWFTITMATNYLRFKND